MTQIDPRTRTPATADAPPRARGLGLFAGLVAIGCCIYPVALVLLGFAGAAEAIALGNNLYGTWGWAFKIGGGVLAVAGIALALAKRGQCSIDGARRNGRYIIGVGIIGTIAYFAVYGITKLLAAWGE